MPRQGLLLLLILLTTACLPDKHKEIVIEKYPGGRVKLVNIYGISHQNITMTKEIGYWESGRLKYTGFRSNGKMDSLWTLWYKDSNRIWEQHQFVQDKRLGWTQRWYFNGQKRSRQLFFYDSRWGLHTEWYENGQKKFEGQWRMNKMTGLWRYWYENGQKQMEGNYCGGEWEELSMFSGKYPDFIPRKDGKWLYWDAYGNLMKTEIWKNGKMLDSQNL
ncbi:MAG TPA: hypothetical protein PKL64_01950 [Bacteroidales bacterium]|nr:hypothetical protein [Bacteroidales bacterium]